MKYKYILVSFTALLVFAISSFGQNPQIKSDTPYTIITNPGEDASVVMRINWHSDIDYKNNYCIYTEATDTNWNNSIKVKAKHIFSDVFNGLYSKTPDNKDIYEEAIFYRCLVKLKHLLPNTKYMYRVGDKELSEVHYFKTAPISGVTNIGIISDFHTYTPLPNRLISAMNMIKTMEKENGKDLDFILHAGDICAWGGSYSTWPYLYAEEAFNKYMWAGVNGNHDNMDRTGKRLSNEYFRQVNNNPLNGYKGEKGVCYHFTYNNSLFIMLNNENMRTAEGLEKAQKWVKKVIKNNPAKYIIVVEHYQWFFGHNGKTSQFERWNKLFDEYGVDLAIAGNNHIYARTNAIFDNKETDGSKGTVYLQTTSADNGRGRVLEEWTGNKDLIKYRWTEGPKTISGIIMTIDETRIKFTLYDRNGKTIDSGIVKAKR